MLEFPDNGNINWLLKKRELDVSKEPSRKRKGREFLPDDELVKRSETSSSGQKKRRFSEDSTNMNANIEEEYHHHHMGLDLELNLSPSLINLNHHHHDHDLSYYNKNYEEEKRKKKKMMEKGSVLGLETRKSMSLVASDLDDDGCRRSSEVQGGGGEEEMVARVCMKCHMLVMLCKVSPACPNCKFMHSPEDTSLSLLFAPKPTLLA